MEENLVKQPWPNQVARNKQRQEAIHQKKHVKVLTNCELKKEFVQYQKQPPRKVEVLKWRLWLNVC